jgi:hypothetical protein
MMRERRIKLACGMRFCRWRARVTSSAPLSTDVGPSLNPTTPSLVTTPDGVFVGWAARRADDDTFFRRLVWNGATGGLSAADAASAIPRVAAHTLGDQRLPTVAWVPNASGMGAGALGLAWDDFGRVLGAKAEPIRDVLLEIAPLPLVPVGP